MKKLLILLALLLSFSIGNIILANDYVLDLESGSSQYLQIIDALQSGLDVDSPTDQITLSAWIKLESDTSSFQTVASKYAGANTQNYELIVDYSPATIAMYTSDCSANVSTMSVSASFSLGVWTHVLVTYDVGAGVSNFWQDGVFLGSDNLDQTGYGDCTSPFAIGRRSDGYWYFDGQIDEVRVYDIVISTSTIEDEYDCGYSGDEDNLISLWNFDSQDATDSNANGNDLTEFNTPTYDNSSLPFANDCDAGGTGTSTATTTTYYATGCDPEYTNDLSMINACTYTSSTTNATYTNYHIPFFIYLAIGIPFLWIAQRLLLEIIIRLREK